MFSRSSFARASFSPVSWAGLGGVEQGAGRGSKREHYSRPWEDFPELRKEDDRRQAEQRIAQRVRKVARRHAETSGLDRANRLAAVALVVAPSAQSSAWLDYYQRLYSSILDRTIASELAAMDREDDELAILLLMGD